VNFSYDYRLSNATTAQTIANKVDSVLLATGAHHVDIITHSMGALSARYYVRNLLPIGDRRVDAVVNLGGTNHGTITAFGCTPISCTEMRPYSSFVTKLSATDETWGTPRYATWWSACDEVIYPQTSAKLSGAVNTQTACLRHSDLHENFTVYTQVRDLVKQTPQGL
jgi:triacylglycerol lipase